MSKDKFLDKLKGFTPKSSGLDRDTLMFAAGQASVRKDRRGNWLIGTLATSQMTTLVLLAVVVWPRTDPGAPQVANLPPVVPTVIDPDRPPLPAPKRPAEPPADGHAKSPAMLPEEIVPEKRLDFVRQNRDWLIENLNLTDPKGLDPKLLAKPAAQDSPSFFEVLLLDGRKITVRPKMEKLTLYNVNADAMEQQVRKRLAELFVEYPEKAKLFAGIVDPGPGVPIFTRPHLNLAGERQTVSMGEPLDELADVEIIGVKGPQAADLERMVRIHWATFGALVREKNMPRTKFEKIFGVGVQLKPRIWSYSIAGCRMLVLFDGDPAKVGIVDYDAAPPPPNFDALAPSERGPYFRAVAKIDRDFLFAFLQIRYRDADADDIANLRRYLDETAGTMEWSELERSQLLPP